MSIFTLQPNADDKADWTENPAGTAFQRLNNTARDNWIETSTADATCRVDYETVTIPAGEVVVYVEAQVDCLAFGCDIEIALLIDSTVRARYTLAVSGTNGVVKLGCTAPFTQAQLNGIRFHCIHRAGAFGGTSFVYSAPLRVHTRADVWEAANVKLRANRDPSTGLSIAAGFMGSDISPATDLGGGRTWMTGGDAGMATASGQQFWFGTNSASPSAPRTSFVRNIGLLLDSYTVESANFTYWTGASNSPYYPDDSAYGGRWPFKHFVHSGRLITVGRFEGAGELVWIAYTDNFSGAPNTWTWTFMPPIRVLCASQPNGEFGVWDDGAGKVYMWSFGPNQGPNSTNMVSLCRVDTTRFHAIDWRRPEWWTGRSWRRDRLAVTKAVGLGVGGRRRARGNLHPALTREIGGQGQVIRRSTDSKFQLVVLDESLFRLPPFEMRYALTPSTTPGTFGPFTSKFTVPEGQSFVYGCNAHPQLTWSGKGSNDQVWTYASNWDDASRTWEPSYFTKFVKALSVT